MSDFPLFHCTVGSKFFHFIVDPFSEGGQKHFWQSCRLESVSISLNLVMLNKLRCHPTSNFQPITLLDPDCCYKFTYLMANSADPDLLASSEANWSDCLQRQGISGFSKIRVEIADVTSINQCLSSFSFLRQSEIMPKIIFWSGVNCQPLTLSMPGTWGKYFSKRHFQYFLL